MAFTRSQLEKVLIRRCGRKLAMAGLDGATDDGSNPDLSDPIAEALASLGLPVANLAATTDADLLAVTDAMATRLRDIAELRALESALGNMNEPDQIADTDNSQSLGRFYDSLEKTVARKRKQAERQYGYGLGGLSAGVFDLGFATTLDPATGWPR